MTSVAALIAEAQARHRARELPAAEALYREVLAEQPDHPGALRGLAAIEFERGRLQEAEAAIRRLMATEPADSALHMSLGVILRRSDQGEAAASAFEAALAIDPFHVDALIALADIRRALGQAGEAVKIAQKAVAIAPQNGEACNLLGASLQSSGRSDAALEWFEKAAAIKPDDARIQYNVAVALQDLRRRDESMAAYGRAIALDPQLMEAQNNLGLLLIESGDCLAAIERLRAAVELKPSSATVWNNLGKALHDAGRLDDALASFDHAIQIDQNYAEAHANKGAVLRVIGRLADALEELDRAISLNGNQADAHANRGIVLRDLGRLDEAYECLSRATDLRPDEPEFHLTMALLHNERAEHPQAEASARRALALDPASVTTHRRLLGILLYQAMDEAERFAECRRFGERFKVEAPAHMRRRPAAGSPQRRLRVGYVSSDLRGDHPVARNLEPLFLNHDRSRFEIAVYADIAAPDATTRRFQSYVDAWRPIDGRRDPEVASLIRSDDIDILVLLAGRFDRNRPQIAAYRPARAHVSFHDPATSGLPHMDYLISDRVLSPRHGGERFTERVLRLPRFYLHAPLESAPPVRPRRAAGRPVFGCFNNPAKLSADCLALWGRVLTAVPEAALHLKFRNWYRSEALRQRVVRALGEAGVGAERVVFGEDDRPGQHHLDAYNDIDVALDPFPFTGSTTTFEALWMGVPVISRAGATMVSRWSAAMLAAVGLLPLTAPAADDYVAAAAGLVRDPVRLAELRRDLRERVRHSGLCDGRARARQIERLYRAIWRRHGTAERS